MAKTNTVIGRQAEQQRLAEVHSSKEAEFVAVYGRRRVGKTHLVREYFEHRAGTYFAVTGEHTGSLPIQLHHFRMALERVFYGGAPLPPIKSWREALAVLADAVDRRTSQRPNATVVLFFDEAPWLDTHRSGFVPALDHAWNTRFVGNRQVRLIVCGSAASWMLNKLVHARGGLYNRITSQLPLDPFTLGEASEFLRSRGIRWKPRQVVDVYMAVGGVPHYLKQMRKGTSPAQAIGQACFDRKGILFEEFPKLFASLFKESDSHEQIVRTLAQAKSGMTRNEVLAKTKLKSGGRFAKHLAELEQAGFLASFVPYGRRTKETSYRLIDEYCTFYLHWIEKAPRSVLSTGGAQYWRAKSTGRSYDSWAGFAFESVCLRHASQLIVALDLQGYVTEAAAWRYLPPKGTKERGAQIDLLLDRTDRAITLCEIKYSDQRFRVNKAYAQDLQRKIEVFARQTNTTKQLLLALVTTEGLTSNTWSEHLVDSVVTIDDLFW